MVVKPTAVAFEVGAVTVASALIEQPVPHDDVAVKMNLMVTEWDRVPVEPVTVTVAFVALPELQDSVAVWGELPNVTLAGRVHESPAGVDGETARLTAPVRPLSAVTVMVDAVEEPAVAEAGWLDVIVKSTTWKTIGPVG